MWPQIFLLAFIDAAASVFAAGDANDNQPKVFRKCCLDSQSLIRVSESSERYECVDSKGLEKRYLISSESLYVGKSVLTKRGFPTECDEFKVLQIRFAETELPPWDNVCYDKVVADIVNGTLISNIPKAVALSCNMSKVDIAPHYKLHINQMRKCCPRGQSFDTEYHECRFDEQQTKRDWLADKLESRNGNIYDVEYGLSCKKDEYPVELYEDAFTLSEEGSNLSVTNGVGDKIAELLPGEWCMEMAYGGSKLVAQVCTRDCGKFDAFCIRKCCPPGHHYKVRHCGSFASACTPNDDLVTKFNISSYLDPLRENNQNLLGKDS